MDFEPLVNVIIVTYNQYDYTEKCVESLLSDGYNNKKIICVDNCSDTASYLNFETKFKNSPNIELVRTPKNLGYGGGCNKGVTAVKEGYIVFLNNDTEVEKNWLNHLVNYMEKNPHVGACQPKIKSLEDRKMFEYAGAAGGMLCQGPVFSYTKYTFQ